VTVTVAEYEPAVVGVPEINPVEELIDNPAGSPEAVYVNVAGGVSVACTCRFTAVPTTVDGTLGRATVTTCVGPAMTVHANVAEPKAPVGSVAVTVTDRVVAAIGVPEINPVAALIDNPVGNPETVYVNVDATESVAITGKLTDAPTIVDCAPGFVTDTTCGAVNVTAQVKRWAAVAPLVSVTETPTLDV
jgi:hypothetical protein